MMIHANGIDIHYVEAGKGVPLLLLHGGMVSTNPIWSHAPIAYQPHLDVLAAGYRVIAPDTRGAGKTVHDAGAVTYDQLADDVIALAEALDLDRPLVAGFSDGGLIATIAGIKDPDRFRGVVSHAGHDLLNPEAPSFAVMRHMLGASHDAIEADPEAFAQMCAQSEQMSAMFELMKADEDGGQGEGYWAEYLRLAFHRTTRPSGYTFDDLARIAAPTLILVGDRDEFCTVEEGALAYRKLADGELAILPASSHVITRQAVELMIDFFDRHTKES
jgi:pimeloyl-ACP methyl ester carboxylesterase